MILRLWRGWTAPEQASAYQQLLTGQIAPAILQRGITGLNDLTVLRRDARELDPTAGSEVLTVMTFDNLSAVAAFAGGDPAAAVVPAAARELLSHWDEHSQHYTSLASFTGR